MTSLYFLAFAFLASTSLLFLLWHCRLSQLRQQELRRLEEEQQEREAELAEARAVAALSGLTLIARGAPSSLIRALPTFSFSTAKNAAAAAAAAAAAREDESDGPDVEMGGSRPDQRPQSGAPFDPQSSGGGGGSGGGSTVPEATAVVVHSPPLPGSGPSTSSAAALADAAQPGGGALGLATGAQTATATAAATAAAAAAAAVASLEECVICLCPYEETDTVKRLPCGHHYHAACVDEWLRKSASCPLCKETLWTATPVSVLPLVDLELLALLHHQLGLRPAAGGAGARWSAATAATAAAAAPRAGRRYGASRTRSRSLPAAVQLYAPRASTAVEASAAETPVAAPPLDAVPRSEEAPDAAPRSQAAGGRSDQGSGGSGSGPGTSMRA